MFQSHCTLSGGSPPKYATQTDRHETGSPGTVVEQGLGIHQPVQSSLWC